MKLMFSTGILAAVISLGLSSGKLQCSPASLPRNSAQEVVWTKGTMCGPAYWTGLNVVVRNFPPSLRLIFVYVEPQTFTQDNLKRIFLCLSEKYPKPEYLKIIARSDKTSLQNWISHYLAVHQIQADGSFKRGATLPKDLPDDLLNEDGFYRSDYDRSDGSEVFSFSTNPNDPNMLSVTLARNWPYRRSGDTTSDLVRASAGGLEDQVRSLLRNAGVNKTNKYGVTPLIAAISSRQRTIASLLIEKGADINQRDADGWTPLMYALTVDDLEMAERLLRAGADVNTAAENGDTALTIATQKDAAGVVSELLRKGADFKVRDRYGRTPMMIAEELGYVTVSGILKQATTRK